MGVVNRKKVIDGRKIRKGDVLLGLASSGAHSNGFSLIRKMFPKSQLERALGKKFLTPTRVYVKPILRLLQSVSLSGIVNITGGGFVDNLPRVIPAGFGARLKRGSWPQPKLFDLVQDSGNISDFEMMRTFNLGIGMILILRKSAVTKAKRILNKLNLPAWEVGEVVKGQGVQIT